MEDAGKPVLALDHVVIGRLAGIGTAVAIAVEAGIDDTGVAGHHAVRIEAQLQDLLRPDIVDESIGAVDQPPQRLLGRGALEVEHDAFLGAVHAQEHGGHARTAPRAHLAHSVAARRFDLDDLGAEIAQGLCGVGAVDDGRQIEDADAPERQNGERQAGSGRP